MKENFLLLGLSEDQRGKVEAYKLFKIYVCV